MAAVSLMASRLPSEEPVRIIPFLGRIDVHAGEPARVVLAGDKGFAETLENRRGRGDAHVCQQAGEEE